MTTYSPILGMTDLAVAGSIPEELVNEHGRTLEWFAAGGPIESRAYVDSASVTPADGKGWLINGTGATDWTGHDNQIAIYINTSWYFFTPKEGMFIYIKDEDVRSQYNGSSWNDFDFRAIQPVTSQSGASYTAVLADQQSYIRFTNVGATTFTIPPNSSVAFDIGTIISVEQTEAAGFVTLTPGAGVTLNSRGGYYVTAGQWAVAQVKKVGTDEWTCIGDLSL